MVRIKCIICLCLVFGMSMTCLPFSVAAISDTDTESASFITRSDGVWFWPLPEYAYNKFTDWAGCNGNYSCMFHPGNNHGGCVPSHSTSNGFGHNGIDIGVVVGTSVYAAADGMLYCTSTDWDYRGITAVVEHPIGNDNNGVEWSYYSIYQHLNSVVSSLDQKEIKAGDTIAYSGMTDGFSTGAPHLHFAILLAESGKGFDMSRDPNNYISAVENKGWLQAEGCAEGRIMNNPALNSPAGYPIGYTAVVPNLIDHAGSIMYTFDKSEVEIGSGYLAKCKSYPSYGTIKATARTNAMSLPCSTGTNEDSVVLEKVSSGDIYVTTALIYNTVGNYWYKVQTSKGETAYIPASKMIHDSANVGDIMITDVSAPSSLKEGDYFSIKGKISATYNKLTTVSAYVHKGTDIYGDIVTGGSDNVSRNSYALYNSDVDMKVLFNKLPAGQYTYAVYVQFDNWHAPTEKTKRNSGGYDHCIYSCTFVVGSSSNVCNHSYKSTWSINSDSHWYECSLCGAKKDQTSHIYDNACDVSCNICAYMRTVAHSYYKAVVIDTTCTEYGYTVYACANCGDSYKDNFVESKGHKYGNWYETKAPTCAESGVERRDCKDCGSHEIRAKAAVEHSYKTTWSKDENNHWRECSVCGAKKDAAVHAYDNACSTICSVCSATRPTTHAWNKGKVTKTATCTSEGVITYTCTKCNQTKTETIEKTDHEYSAEWLSDASRHWHECSACGKKKNAADHNPGAAATEDTAQTCTICGYVIQAAWGHTHQYGEQWISNGSNHWHECSCGKKSDVVTHGYNDSCDSFCDVCGHTREIFHSWDSGVITKEATCSVVGEMTHTCAVCGATNTEDIPINDTHNWDNGVDSEDGTSKYTCLDCGSTKIENNPVLPTETTDISNPSVPTETKTSTPVQQPEGTEPTNPQNDGKQGTSILDDLMWPIIVLAVLCMVLALVLGIMIGKKKI